jgi:hypothetical protein
MKTKLVRTAVNSDSRFIDAKERHSRLCARTELPAPRQGI